MKVAILETVKANAGFELEYDRIIIETLKKMGHEPVLMIPQGSYDLERNFHIPVIYLQGGAIVSYDGIKGIKKIWLSVLRERRRVAWFNSAYDIVNRNDIDVILITTATYRYLRSLKKSRLKNSPIPVNFMFLGINPQEMPKFKEKAANCVSYSNIRLFITTLRNDFGDELPPNAKLILPPVMVPDSCHMQRQHDPLRIGFFGHFRQRDKNLDLIFSAITKCRFDIPVKFVLQLVPTTDSDRIVVQQIVKKYKNNEQVEFITHALLGDDWYNAIQGVDVVFLPYMAERYLYNWSAIYFTSIGCYKPVLTTATLNPEVMAEFKIGEIVDLDNVEIFIEQLQEFVNNYSERNINYYKELARANEKYSKEAFVKKLLV